MQQCFVNEFFVDLLPKSFYMKRSLLAGILFTGLSYAQNVCVSNLGGDTDPSFIEIRINSTAFNHQTFSAQNEFYHAYPASGNTTATLNAGQAYQFYTSTSSEAVIGIWLDENRNGVFEQQEYQQLVNSMVTQNTKTFTVPASAANGNTLLRIRSRAYGSSISALDACSPFGSGETRDYTVNIISSQLGTKDITAADQFRLYPNPAADFVTVEGKETILFVEIYTLEGRKLALQQINNIRGSVDLSAYIPGEYVVQVNTRSGKKTYRVSKK